MMFTALTFVFIGLCPTTAEPKLPEFDFSHRKFPPGTEPRWLVPTPSFPWHYDDSPIVKSYFPDLIKCNENTYEGFELWLNVADRREKKTYVHNRAGLGEYDAAWSFVIPGGIGPKGKDPDITVHFRQARGFLQNVLRTAYYQYQYASYEVESHSKNCTIVRAGPQPN